MRLSVPVEMETGLTEREQMIYEMIIKNGDSSEFVQMMLNVIHDTLKDYEENDDQVKIDNPNLIKLLGAIGDDTLSAVEIMRRIGLSHRPTFRKNYLNPALELNLIERTIPDKPNSRNQRYRKKQL